MFANNYNQGPRGNQPSNGGNFHNSNNSKGRSFTSPSESPEYVFGNANYQSSWITNEADSKLVEFAEIMGKYMAENGLTKSKIRSIYGEIIRIQMRGYEREKASFFLLRPKVAYALARDKNNKGLQLFKLIFDDCYKAVSNQKTYLNFCNLLEAILAYHKANGGKD